MATYRLQSPAKVNNGVDCSSISRAISVPSRRAGLLVPFCLSTPICQMQIILRLCSLRLFVVKMSKVSKPNSRIPHSQSNTPRVKKPLTRILTLLIVFCVHVLLLVGRCEFRPNTKSEELSHESVETNLCRRCPTVA